MNDHLVARLRHRRDRHRAASKRFFDTPVRDPRGGITDVDTVLRRAVTSHRVIDGEERAGSVRHHRITRGRRLLVGLLPVLDGLILFWFLAGVLNTDLSVLEVTTVVAAGLAVLCSVAVAAWNSTVGQHLQKAKDHEGGLVLAEIDIVGRALLAATALMWLLLAVMMYVRVEDEVYQATGTAGVGGTVVAVTLAVAILLVNAYVLYLAFADGSPETRQLDGLGRVIKPPARAMRRHSWKAERAELQITYRLAERERLHALPLERRGHELPAGPEVEQPERWIHGRQQSGASAETPNTGDPVDPR